MTKQPVEMIPDRECGSRIGFHNAISKVDAVGLVDSEVYHNTELLLKLYRKVLFRVNRKLQQANEEALFTERQKLTDNIGFITEFDTKNHKAKIYEKLLSMGSSLCLLEAMEDALIALKEYPDKGSTHYEILRYAYFDSISMTHEQIMEYCRLSYATYYRYRRTAIKTYAAMLWGYVLPELEHRPVLPGDSQMIVN